jgi:Ni/Co efflux regulator RcnB
MNEGRKRMFLLIAAAAFGLVAAGCAIQASDDPNLRYRIEQSLRSEQDWAYWNEWLRQRADGNRVSSPCFPAFIPVDDEGRRGMMRSVARSEPIGNYHENAVGDNLSP